MRRLLLVLAALTFAPAALAQTVTDVSGLRAGAAPSARTAGVMADTLGLSNLPATYDLSVFSFEGAGPVTGKNEFYSQFGSAYTLPDGDDYVVLGAEPYFFETAGAGQSFDLLVYEGTVEDGPQGEPIYAQTFDASVLVPPETDSGGTTVFPTTLFFDEPVEVEGPVFFVAYDFENTTDPVSVVSTADLDTPSPEVVAYELDGPGIWTQVQDIFTDPLEIQLLAFALVQAQSNEPVTIAEARAEGEGATVTVEGVVTRAEGAFVYLQDETGGLTLRQTSGEVFEAVASGALPRGSVLRVTGTLSQFNSLLQINGADLVASAGVGSAEVPAPQTVTLAEIAQDGEDYEGELVRVTGVSFDAPPDQFAAATSYAVTDGSGTGTVRVPNAGDTELEGTDFTGNPATITGIVTQFSASDPAAGYQILVLTAGDVLPAAVAAEGGLEAAFGLSAPAPNPAGRSAEVVVSLAAPGRAVVAVYDALGREVARALDRDLSAGDHAVRIGLEALAAGRYVVRLTTAAGTASRPLAVAR